MTAVAERTRTVYAAVVYHDSEWNANESERDLGYFGSLKLAVAAVNAARSDYWQTGGVTRGELHEAVPGIRPEHFESEVGWTWFVGTDGKAER